ncbi:MAG: hypothetical protein IKX67_07160 [Bacteroidales bacterium]|nr:hypothetical protein [Bacteroidales bacterium]
MGINRITPKGSEERYVRERTDALIAGIISGFIKVGDDVCRIASQSHKYQDQTGNLSSSIGYCILRDGEIVHEGGFTVVKDGAAGAAKGKEYLHQLAKEHPSGIVLIIVAGMEYSGYVEAMGLDVLDSATIRVREMVDELLSKLGIR